jgi:MFS family permease
MLPHKALNLLVTYVASRMMDHQVEQFSWKTLIKTIPIWMGFFTFGICGFVRGPTILDLKEILDVEISEISLIFTFFSMGSLAGCILSSLILDKLRKYRFLVLGGSLLLMGSSTAALPYSYNQIWGSLMCTTKMKMNIFCTSIKGR